MVEFCVAAPVLILLLWSLLYVKEMFIIKHETLVAARYGTWLLSRYDNVSVNSIDRRQVETLIKQNFFKKRPQENIAVAPNHMYSNWEDLYFSKGKSGAIIQWVSGYLSKNLLKTGTPAIYSLNVRYKYPKVFGAVDLRDGSNNYFEIQSYHYVLGNSWDGQRIGVHDIKEMIEEWIGDILKAVVDLL